MSYTPALFSSIKPIDKFDEVEIHPTAVLPVERGIGVMLEVIPKPQRTGWTARDSEGPDELPGAAKFLPAEFAIAQERAD